MTNIADFYQSLDDDYADDAKKIKAFIQWAKQNRNLDESIIIAVIKQFEVEEFISYAADVTNHGIMGGFGGFVWYTETTAFYTANKEGIIKWAKDLNDSIGEAESYLIMIANFNIMKKADFSIDNVAEFIYSDNDELDDYTQFANNMAWVVAEDICHHYVDFLEDSDYSDEDEE